MPIRASLRHFDLMDRPRYKFTLDDYYRLADAGIIQYGARLELIDGEIVVMPLAGPKHRECVDLLTELMTLAVVGRARVRVSGPIWPNENTELLPDIAVLKRQRSRLMRPGPDEALLVVEVVDSATAEDAESTLPIYAGARDFVSSGSSTSLRPRSFATRNPLRISTDWNSDSSRAIASQSS